MVITGSSCHGSTETNPNSIHEDVGSIPAHSLGQGSGVAKSCGVHHRRSSDLALVWLWCRPAAVAPIQPLAWELPYPAPAALKKEKKKKRMVITFLDVTINSCICTSQILHFASWSAKTKLHPT